MDIVDKVGPLGHEPSDAEDQATQTGPFAVIDDGTGVVYVSFGHVYGERVKFGKPWIAAPGMYVLVLAQLVLQDSIMIGEAFRVKDLSSDPDRLPMWWCELINAHQHSTACMLGA